MDYLQNILDDSLKNKHLFGFSLPPKPNIQQAQLDLLLKLQEQSQLARPTCATLSPGGVVGFFGGRFWEFWSVTITK